MRIELFGHDDLDPFLALAGSEGWICDRWEFAFLLENAPRCCFVARGEEGAAGFVTACIHGNSGWIGNLIVRAELRGQGIGRTLMGKAIAALDSCGASTIWLTASAAGKPLYETLGFVAVDTINRWRGTGRAGRNEADPGTPGIPPLEVDFRGWGDRREALLQGTAARGVMLAGADGFLVMQPSAAGIQLGPWGGLSREVADQLLERALVRGGEGTPLVLDSPAGNPSAPAMLRSAGFGICGETVLMYRGVPPAYNPAFVYALASMGSMG